MTKMTPSISPTWVAILSIAAVTDLSQAASVWQPVKPFQERAEPTESDDPSPPKSTTPATKSPESEKPPATTSKAPEPKPTTQAPATTAAPKTTAKTTAAATTSAAPKSTTPAKTTPKGIVPVQSEASHSSVIASASISGTSSSAPSSASSQAADSSSGISGGAIGGIIAAVVVCVAGVAAFVVMRRKKAARRKRALKADPFNRGFGSHDPPPTDDLNYPPHTAYAMSSTNYQYNTSPSPVVPSSNTPATGVAYGAYRAEEPITAPYSPEQSAAYYQAQQQYYGDPSNVYSPQLNTANYGNSAYPDPNMYNNGYDANGAYAGNPQAAYSDPANAGYYGDNTAAAYNGAPNNPNAYGFNSNTPMVAVAAAPIAAGAAAVYHQTAMSPTQQHQVPPQQIQPTVLEPITQPQQQQQQPSVAQPPPVSQSLGVYTVTSTYTPTLGDELEIQIGDRIEILVEYDDGWCQGINLSKGNAKGVFPKHCVESGNAASGLAPSTTLNPLAEVERTKRVSSMYTMQQHTGQPSNHL